MENNIFDQLDSLNDEEFMKLISNYNLSKMSTLSVNEQRYVKDSLSAEMERRSELLSKKYLYKEGIINDIDDIERRIEMFIEITGENYKSYPAFIAVEEELKQNLQGLQQDLSRVNNEINNCEIIMDSVRKVISSTGLSIAKRRLDVGKKALFVTAPQKICTLSRTLLDKMKNNVNKFGEASLRLSNDVDNKFEEYSEKNDDALKAIDESLDDLMQDMGQMHGYEKYQAQKTAEKNMEKMGRKYRRVERKGKIVSKLRPGIVRMLKVPSKIIDKLSGGAYDPSVPIQDSTSMSL